MKENDTEGKYNEKCERKGKINGKGREEGKDRARHQAARYYLMHGCQTVKLRPSQASVGFFCLRAR